MKRVVLGSSFLIALALPLVHCSSKSSGSPANPVDSGTTHDSGTNGVVDSGGAVTDSGTSVSDSAAPDTGSVVPSDGGCVIPPGGQPCNPGVVTCNGSACDVPANFCCGNVNDAGMTSESCDTKGTTCGGVAESCDETADCPTGGVCCLVATSASVSGISVACQTSTSCSGGLFAVQVCKSDTECPNGQCIPQYCSLASLTIEACGLVPTCTALDAGM